MTRALALLVLVGCADGVIVEVDTQGLDVATVELVLSDRLCEDPRGGECVTIQGPTFKFGFGEKGDIFTRGASATSSDLEEGIARFELPAADNRITMAFAIGRDAQGQIVGAAVMANTIDLAAGPVVYRAALDQTEELRDPSQPGAAASEWGKECVGIKPLHSTLDVQRPIFMLPAVDPDCDGRVDDECDPLWFDGMLYDESSAAHCAQPSMVLPGAPCVIGHIPQCVEANPDVMSCIEAPFRCFPDVVCNSCAAKDTACQNERLSSPAIATRMDCTIPATISIDDDLGTACLNNTTFFIDSTSLPMVGNGTCTGAEFVKTPSSAIDAEVDSRAEFGDARIDIIRVTPTCKIEFEWDGSIPAATVTTLHTVLIIHIEVSGQRREIWMPLNFTASSACIQPTGMSTCQFVGKPGDDAIINCAL